MNTDSRFKVGERTAFQPCIRSIDFSDGTSDHTAIPCLVVGVCQAEGKVLYDIALPDGEGGFYMPYPLRSVDSVFLVRQVDSSNTDMETI